MKEIFYPISELPDYFITKSGKVAGRKKCLSNQKQELREIKPYDRKGYLAVKLRKGKNRKTYNVHRLVAMMFVPNPNNFPCVNHKDRNRQNNYYKNLEWCSTEYNNLYGTLHGVKMKRTNCAAYINDTLIGKFNSVLEAADFIINNYEIPCINGLSVSLESYDTEGNLFRIVRDGKDTFEWNAKRNKLYTDFQNKSNHNTQRHSCVLIQGHSIIQTFNSKNRLYSWVRANLNIPVSHLIKYGKYQDYHVEEIKKKCTD